MIVNGKELKLYYSIGAYARISDLCQNHSFKNLAALLAGNYAEAIINITLILQDAYYNAFPDETAEKVTRADLSNLKQFEFEALDQAVSTAMNEGATQTVAAAESKKKAPETST